MATSYGHENRFGSPTRNLCKRLKVPSYYQQLAELTCEYHTHIHKIFELRPETVVKLFNTFDVWRKPLRFMEFLLVCFADTRGRKGFEHSQYPQQEFALALYQAALKVDIQSIIAAGFENKAIRDQLNRGRIFAVKQKTHGNLTAPLNLSYRLIRMNGLLRPQGCVKYFHFFWINYCL